jgi:RNA polymerase sigma factor (sigma-70 family)
MEARCAQPIPIGGGPALGRARRTAALLADHGDELRRVARRVSLCEDDVDDAVQRTAMILLRKAPAVEAAALLRWSRVVVRREALAVARARSRALTAAGRDGGEPVGPESIASERPGPAAALEARDRTAAAAVCLGRLKPSERRALALQAAGCSYAEIQAITGWTYTKVNRSLAEGRAALREMEAPAA